MILTKEEIAKLPVISEEEADFYLDGEFEAAVLEDFNRAVDEIDKCDIHQAP